MTHIDQPPSALQAEQDLLGALIAGTAALADLSGFSADWFHDPVHAAIYRTIANGTPTDLGSLSSILAPCSAAFDGPEPGSVLEEVGGAGYLADLASRSVSDLTEAALRIKDAWLRRQLISLGCSLVDPSLIASGADALELTTRRVVELATAVRS